MAAALVLKSIADPQNVKRLILEQANKVRVQWNEWRQQQTIERNRAGAAQVFASRSPAASPTQADDDPMAKLTKLGEMKEAGLLTDEAVHVRQHKTPWRGWASRPGLSRVAIRSVPTRSPARRRGRARPTLCRIVKA
jgi:hypothetical protein